MQLENALGEKLRTAHGLVLGSAGFTSYAPNGMPYDVLQGVGGEPEAAAAFAEYVAGRMGVLHWRVMPEVASYKRGLRFYMRLFLETASKALDNV